MSYFNKFPKLIYDIKGNGEVSLFTHILKRVKLNAVSTTNTQLFDYYQVSQGEKPEDIAFKYYGDATLHWVILLVNDVVDRFHQWPMTVPQFEKFVADKYTNPDGLHHYEITQTSGDTTEVINVGMNTTDYPSALPISNYQYEQKLQEQKAQIRLIQPRFITDFVKEFEKKIKEGV